MSLPPEMNGEYFLTGQLLVKGSDNKVYSFEPALNDIHFSEMFEDHFGYFSSTLTLDRSDEPKPLEESYTATNSSSEPVTTHADYDYSINDDSYVFAGAKVHDCKDGEIYVYPDDQVITVTSLPCTLKLGHYLKYKIVSGGGYYYAYGQTTTLDITEPGTYPVETIVIGGISFGTPPPWYGYTAEVVVEESGSEYKITIKDFTFYTHDAAVKYREWMNRPKKTTLALKRNGYVLTSMNLTEITDYIKSLEKSIDTLEQRVAELEALHNDS